MCLPKADRKAIYMCMSLVFDQHPGGMVENSPAFQRWVRPAPQVSPEWTSAISMLNRPFGTWRPRLSVPALKRWAILICPSGTDAEPRVLDSDYRPARSLQL